MRCLRLAHLVAGITATWSGSLTADELRGLDIDAAIAKIDGGQFEDNFAAGHEYKGWFALAPPPVDTDLGAMSSCVMDKMLGLGEIFIAGRGGGADHSGPVDHTSVADLLVDVPACCRKGAKNASRRAACLAELREGYGVLARMHDQCADGDGGGGGASDDRADMNASMASATASQCGRCKKV